MQNKKLQKAILSLLLAGGMCASVACSTPAPAEMSAQDANIVIGDSVVPLASVPKLSKVLVPAATGTTAYTTGGVTLDASNASKGYVMVKYPTAGDKIKVQVTKSGGTTYTYDLNSRNAYEVFPLTDGNGSYTVGVYKNTSGSKYAQLLGKTISVSLENEFLPFLYPNQYVNFSDGSAAVKKGAELASGAADQTAAVKAIYEYVIKNVSYDTAKANSVKSGYLPNVDSTLSSKKGICFDYAALMTAMLRSQDIPTKLVVGYTGEVYHAWLNVYLEGKGWVDTAIYFNGENWALMDPTFASTGKNSEAIKKYIGDGANYKAKYTY